MSRPLFLLGMMRSGTTLLQRILNSVDGVLLTGEHGGYVAGLADGYFDMDEALAKRPKRALPSPADVVGDLENPRLFSAWSNWYDPAHIARMHRYLIQALVVPPGAPNRRYWGFKEIRYGHDDRAIELLLHLYPEAQFVFLARHPVPAIGSQYATGWIEGGVPEELPKRWADRYAYYLELAADQPQRCRLIRHEDVVTGTAAGLPDLFTALDLDLGDARPEIVEFRRGRRPRPVDPVHEFDGDAVLRTLEVTSEVRAELGYADEPPTIR